MSSLEMNFHWQSIYGEIDGKLCILRLSFIATLLFDVLNVFPEYCTQVTGHPV